MKLSRSLSWGVLGLGLFVANAGFASSSEECVIGGATLLRHVETGERFGSVETLCRKGRVSKKPLIKRKFCKATFDGELSDFPAWCASHAIPFKDPKGKVKIVGNVEAKGGPDFIREVKDTWSKGLCYVPGMGKCTAGKQVAQGCEQPEAIYSVYYYRTTCQAPSLAVEDTCWVGKSVDRGEDRKGCRAGTPVRVDGVLKGCQVKDAKDGLATVFSNDNNCVSKTDTAFREPPQHEIPEWKIRSGQRVKTLDDVFPVGKAESAPAVNGAAVGN
jgi:hypothetical protein